MQYQKMRKKAFRRGVAEKPVPEADGMNLDTILLYAGAGIALLALLALIFSLCRYHLAAGKLNRQLDSEYGPKLGL